MKFKINSAEISMMAKFIARNVDPKSPTHSFAEITVTSEALILRGNNGTRFVEMRTPMLGYEEETACVDAAMLSNVLSNQHGDVEIATDAKALTITGTGRTRLVKLEPQIILPPEVKGSSISVAASDLQRAYDAVSHAIAGDNSRPILTGILMEAEGGKLRMVTLDGFQMSVETIDCEGADARFVVPGAAMKSIVGCMAESERVTITADGHHVRLSTPGTNVTSVMLSGEFVDYRRVLPTEFKTDVLMKKDELIRALRGSQIVGNAKQPVKFTIGSDATILSNNGETAGFTADIDCMVNGEKMNIAFNERYVVNALNSIGADEVQLRLTSSTSAAIMQGKGCDGVRLFLPVRVM